MSVVRPRRTRFLRVLPAVVCAATALLAGCGGNTLFLPGTPVMSMGSPNNGADFTSYIIAVDSITLTAPDGTVAAPLVSVETVDFATQNFLTELVSAGPVPEDTYTSATIVLDYSLPSIWLKGDGLPVLATPVTPAGDAVGAVSLTVTFDPKHPLVVNNNQSVRLHIDFDLSASNTVTNTFPGVVAVQPFATIGTAPVDSTVMRARGLFVTVPTGTSVPAGTSVPPGTSGDFIMNLRPFYDLVSALGAVFVNTNAQTYWNIYGKAYTGAAGLAALAAQQESTPIVAYGTLDNLSAITPSFNATQVYVGSSQEGELAEYLTGVVAARIGNSLKLVGVTYLTPSGGFSYVASTTVVIGPDTIVSQDGVAAAGLSAASVSVGQMINVSGQAQLDSSGDLLYLDGTAGQVRLMPTTLWGTLNSATPGSASLNLLTLNNYFHPGVYAFEGTGPPGQPADHNAYIVNSGTLDFGAFAPGTLLQTQGLVTPFGTAPPAFDATSVTAGSATLQTLVIEWEHGGSTHPFQSIHSSGLVVDASDPNIGDAAYIRTGPAEMSLKTLPAFPLITTVGADQSHLELAFGSETLSGGIHVFNDVDGFDAALTDVWNGTNKIYRLVAFGQYDAASNTFVAARIHVALEETT